MAQLAGGWTFRGVQWLFPFAVAIHNTEEGLWMPSWWLRHPHEIPWHIPAAAFRIALAILTAAAFLVTWLSRRQGRNSVWTYLFVGYVVVMWLNVFLPHIPAALWFHAYVPGVVSACLVVFPVTSALLILAFRERAGRADAVGN
jgi:hypothetical protein